MRPTSLSAPDVLVMLTSAADFGEPRLARGSGSATPLQRLFEALRRDPYGRDGTRHTGGNPIKLVLTLFCRIASGRGDQASSDSGIARES